MATLCKLAVTEEILGTGFESHSDGSYHVSLIVYQNPSQANLGGESEKMRRTEHKIRRRWVFSSWSEFSVTGLCVIIGFRVCLLRFKLLYISEFKRTLMARVSFLIPPLVIRADLP